MLCHTNSRKNKKFSLGKCVVKLVDSAVNLAVLAAFLLLFAYGCYALWDSEQVYATSDSSRYEVYKPTEDDSLSFQELVAMNPEVFGWLTVYGTQIDYPLVQAQDNDKYINTDVEGNFSLGGSIFLDYRNSRDFSDFNSIIYGHHMAEAAMFGELAEFKEKSYFDSHPYGSLYYHGKSWGLEFFAFIEADAYDTSIYTPGISLENREAYLENILSKATHVRNTQVTVDDRLVLLSTCTSDSTNGRHILVGRILDQVPEDPFS
ncbi:MAG TPA: class B sortase [Candidatus Scybalocola faecavium]|nr:class B sortase [Candidatus Scybalocola faecavium]